MTISNEGRIAYRGIAPDLHKRMKAQAVLRGETLGSVMTQALIQWLARNEGKERPHAKRRSSV